MSTKIGMGIYQFHWTICSQLWRFAWGNEGVFPNSVGILGSFWEKPKLSENLVIFHLCFSIFSQVTWKFYARLFILEKTNTWLNSGFFHFPEISKRTVLKLIDFAPKLGVLASNGFEILLVLLVLIVSLFWFSTYVVSIRYWLLSLFYLGIFDVINESFRVFTILFSPHVTLHASPNSDRYSV